MSTASPKRALALAFLATCFFVLPACAGGASFHRGVIGVRLPYRVGTYAAWSPDGRWIAIPTKAGPKLRNVRTKAIRQLHAPAFQGFPVRPGHLYWAPGGKTIKYATSIGPRQENVSWLTEVPLDGSEVRQQPLGAKAFDTSWAPSGWPFAFTTGTYAYDFEKGPIGPKPSLFAVDRFGEPPRRIAQINHDIGEAFLSEAQFSPNGKRILFSRGQRRRVGIWTVRPDGTDPRRLWTGLAGCESLHWSPNGRQVFLLAQKSGTLRSRLYLLPADGGKPRRVGDQEVLDGPIWSPDGFWLTYSTYDEEIRRVHPDGSDDQLIAKLPGQEIRGLLWSPDDRHLAYTARDFPPED